MKTALAVQTPAINMAMPDEIFISDIIVGERYRKDLGDIGPLADSIRAIGLLHPIVVSTDNRLVAGERRLTAMQELGWSKCPVRRISIDAIVIGEHDENEVRKDFTPSERVAIARAVAAGMGERRGGDTSTGEQSNPQNIGEWKGVETAVIAARKSGFGNPETYRQAKAVVETATPELVEAMDAGKVSISAAHGVSKLSPDIQRDVTSAGDPRKAAREAVLAAVASTSAPASGRNPNYKPNPQYSEMAMLTGYCQSISDQVARHGAEYIVGGFVDAEMKGREVARIQTTIDDLNALLEAADA